MGVLWRTLAPIDREAFSEEARRLQNLHSLEFPDYKYKPRKRNRAGSREPPAEPSGPPPPPAPADPHNGIDSPLYSIPSFLPCKLANRKSISLNEMASRLDASSPLMVQLPDQQTRAEPPSSLEVDTSSSTSLSHCCSDGRSINWAGSVHQAVLEGEEEEEIEGWTLDPRTLCCPPEAWTNAVTANASENREKWPQEPHLSYTPFSTLSPTLYKCQLSPVDCSLTSLCHHLKPEDNQVSPAESRFPLSAPKSPSVELALPCCRDATGETTWSLPIRGTPSPTDPPCVGQLYAANLGAQRQQDEREAAGTEVMRNLMASGLIESGIDPLHPDGLLDLLNYTKFQQMASCLQSSTTTTTQEADSRTEVAPATTDSGEAPETTSLPSSPPTRQTALPSIESWVRNANFSP
ncbi:unnamed protein product [Schistocephalus solidus]|uniref:Sex-determining region Y protein n=1 Tax=Schistocephalus solidus TaxID=70667 RepID=A0A183TAE8_SCHSO|nr:unnamed protein product [Schistocephalus solidus]